MGYTTCSGGGTHAPHPEERSCDGCDKCPRCSTLFMAKLWCWKCCGRLIACPDCAPRMAAHIVEKGPPRVTAEGFDFTGPEILAGYRAALSITRESPKTQKEVLQRYPLLVAHLISESLGYFTPASAANAVLHYTQGEPNFCEWYSHMAGGMHPPSFEKDALLAVGRRVLGDAFQRRRGHTGYMADYQRARILVEHVRRGGDGPVLASWF